MSKPRNYCVGEKESRSSTNGHGGFEYGQAVARYGCALPQAKASEAIACSKFMATVEMDGMVKGSHRGVIFSQVQGLVEQSHTEAIKHH